MVPKKLKQACQNQEWVMSGDNNDKYGRPPSGTKQVHFHWWNNLGSVCLKIGEIHIPPAGGFDDLGIDEKNAWAAALTEHNGGGLTDEWATVLNMIA